MSLIILSDTHMRGGGDNIPAPLADLLRQADMIAHAGDFVSSEALKYFQSAGKTVGVAGNMDRYDVAKELPQKKIFDYSGRKIGLIHGHQAHQDLRLNVEPGDDYSSSAMIPFFKYLEMEFPQCEVIIFGHFHLAGIVRRSGRLLINPGTANPQSKNRTCAELQVIHDKIDAKIINF